MKSHKFRNCHKSSFLAFKTPNHEFSIQLKDHLFSILFFLQDNSFCNRNFFLALQMIFARSDKSVCFSIWVSTVNSFVFKAQSGWNFYVIEWIRESLRPSSFLVIFWILVENFSWLWVIISWVVAVNCLAVKTNGSERVFVWFFKSMIKSILDS